MVRGKRLGGLSDAGRAIVVWALICLVTIGEAWAEGAAPEIGTAVVIKRDVVATLGEDKRDLQEGNRVHRTEYLETGEEALAELRLDDQTKLALGPNAGLKLDEVVVGKSEGVTTIGVNFVKGTFRFITGSGKKDAYRIETPSATIGVRGTVFDVYVDGKGDTLVLLHEGEVDICTRSKKCRRHDSVGRIVHATIAGVLSAPMKFVPDLIPGVGVGAAFPFVGKKLQLDPIRRLSPTRILESPTKKAGRTLNGGGKNIGRTIRKALPF